MVGYYAFQNIWLHLLWFAGAVVYPLLRVNPLPSALMVGKPPFLKAVLLFFLAMLVLAFRPGAPLPDASNGWRVPLLFFDVWLLFLFIVLAYRMGLRPGSGRKTLTALVYVAGVTALLSAVIFYGIQGHRVTHSRFENLLVHFGLAPVLTGLLYGFAGLAAAALSIDESDQRKRRLLLALQSVLLLAALCSHTRGAVLALGGGFLVLLVVAWHRRTFPAMVVLAAVLLAYQVVIPHLPWERPASPPGVDPPPGQAEPAKPPAANPAKGLLARKDAGRMALYRLLFERIDSPWEHLLGRGHWADDQGDDTIWGGELWAKHPHSAFLATYYRGGAVGHGLLALVMLLGSTSAWRAARSGCLLWAPLWGYGATALIFDGDDLIRMATLPRVEPLLFWFPLAAAAGAAARLARRKAQAKS